MKNTIIYAHPWENSFNAAVLKKAIEAIENHNETYELIDLYKDGFDPVMSAEDLKVYSQGKTNYPLIEKYNGILDDTERIILIFPMWWYDMPAIMRGFFDKVMLNGSAYTEDEMGMHPVRSIDNTVVLTTSSAPTDALINNFNDPINSTIIGSTFKCIGFNNGKWFNLDTITRNTDEARKHHLNKIDNYIFG